MGSSPHSASGYCANGLSGGRLLHTCNLRAYARTHTHTQTPLNSLSWLHKVDQAGLEFTIDPGIQSWDKKECSASPRLTLAFKRLRTTRVTRVRVKKQKREEKLCSRPRWVGFNPNTQVAETELKASLVYRVEFQDS